MTLSVWCTWLCLVWDFCPFLLSTDREKNHPKYLKEPLRNPSPSVKTPLWNVLDLGQLLPHKGCVQFRTFQSWVIAGSPCLSCSRALLWGGMELGTQGWLEDGSCQPSLSPTSAHPAWRALSTPTPAKPLHPHSWVPPRSLPLTQLLLGRILARSSPSPGKSNTRSVLFAAMDVNLGVKGFAACPHAGLAASSPMIYALIWECLFLPGDHMAPCLHVIFVFAFASLPSLLPSSKWFSFLLKQFILAVAKKLIGFGTRSDKLCMVILEVGACLG